MKRTVLFLFGLAVLIQQATSQDIQPTTAQTPPIERPRGSLYFQWGYNRDWYSKSDIRFVNHTSANYDFTFYNATAHDKPDMENWWYIDRLTIPQYDMTIGYMFNNKNDLGIELGWNHLKYVVTDNQVMHMKGEINGVFYDKDTLVTPDFVHLQHTNGNNYLIVSLVKRHIFWENKNFQLSAIGKVGAGPMISYTISSIMGNLDKGYFHYHGWVAATSLGVRLQFLKNFYIQSDMQGAYADYTNTRLGADHLGLSTQHFYSAQWTWEGGFIFPLGKRK